MTKNRFLNVRRIFNKWLFNHWFYGKGKETVFSQSLIFFSIRREKPSGGIICPSLPKRAYNKKWSKDPKSLKQRLLLGLTFFLFPLLSYSSSETIPVKEIFIQVFNFSIFVAIFAFLIRKPIKHFFHKRQKEFFSFEEQAAQWEKEKWKEHQEWENKLEVLKKQEKEIKQKAQREGEKFLFQKKEELKNFQIRLKKEAHFLLRLEREKSKEDLLKKWRGKVAQAAGLDLEKQAGSSDFQSKRLKDFFWQMEFRL